MHGEDLLNISRRYPRREWISRFWPVVVAIPLVASGCEMIEPLPGDAYLLRKFTKQRAIFDRLVQMAHEDSKFAVIDSSWTFPVSYTTQNGERKGLTAQRWDEYKRLFGEIGLDGIRWWPPGGEYSGLFLVASANGTIFGGSMKGYFHIDSDEQPKSILAEIPWRLPPEADVHGPNGEIQHSEAFRKIKNHWFLYRIDD